VTEHEKHIRPAWTCRHVLACCFDKK
jgi:hypothetical protein